MRTRRIARSPVAGGAACGAEDERRPCSAGPCSRDCELLRWTEWSLCSAACGGGVQERVRRVARQADSGGSCPPPASEARLQTRACNMQRCAGNEICVAQQDLLIAVDGSGASRERDFTALRQIASEVAGRYAARHNGQEAARVGVVQFGSAGLDSSGMPLPALNVLPLTNDIVRAHRAAEGLQWIRGLPNLEQALSLAERSLRVGGRRGVEAAVLLLGIGTPHQSLVTQQQVQRLLDRQVRLLFAALPQTTNASNLTAPKQGWTGRQASALPEVANTTGLLRLRQANLGGAPEQIVARLCPHVVAPSSARVVRSGDEPPAFALVRAGAHCGPRGKLLSQDVKSAAECAARAAGIQAQAFSLGFGDRRGWCFEEGVVVNRTVLERWEQNREDPPCPWGDWTDDELFDFYAIEPPL